MTLQSDKHNNYDVHDTLQCQILHQSGVLYIYAFIFTVYSPYPETLSSLYFHNGYMETMLFWDIASYVANLILIFQCLRGSKSLFYWV